MHVFKSARVFVGIYLLLAGQLLWAAPKEQTVSLTTKDGWALNAVYLPASSQDTTAVLLHDLGKNKEAFASFRQALAKAGFGYLAIDLRGHGQSTSGGTYKNFAKEGPDNPFNKMAQDTQAAVNFLTSKSVPLQNIVLIGIGLGANVAAKTAGALPNIKAIALISPGVNIRDVLTVPALRAYKGAVLLAASADERKGFLEASILRNVAFLTTGEGNVTFLTAYDLSSHALLDKYLTPALLQWLSTPTKPEVLPDANPLPARNDDTAVLTQGIPVAPSNTEQALMPSVLAE